MGKHDANKPPVVAKEIAGKLSPLPGTFPGPRGAVSPLRVSFARQAYADLTAHAQGSLDAEVCGVLVGNLREDDEGAWVDVEAVIRGAAVRGGTRHVTFTQETWTAIHETLERDFAGRRIVGWYHTHPGFGVEFSDMDLFIQRNFFPLPTQLALVTDPLGGAVAVCANAAGGGIDYLDRFWVAGREQACRKPAAAAVAGGDAPADGALAAAVRSMEERLNQALVALDETRTAYHRLLAMVAVVFCAGIVAVAGFIIYRAYKAETKPPQLLSYVPIPIQIGDKTVLVGVGVIDWQVPPELDAIKVEITRQMIEEAAQAEKARAAAGMAAPPAGPGAPAPASPAPAGPAAPPSPAAPVPAPP